MASGTTIRRETSMARSAPTADIPKPRPSIKHASHTHVLTFKERLARREFNGRPEWEQEAIKGIAFMQILEQLVNGDRSASE
jgi:hypothetical protein